MPQNPNPLAPEPVTDTTAPAGGPPQKRFWSPLVAVLLAAVLFIGAQLVASVPFIIYANLRHWNSAIANSWLSGTYPQFWFVLVAETITFAGLWWFTRRGGLTLRDIGWRRFNGWAIVYALAGFAVYFIAYVVLLAIASALLPNINLNQQQDIGFQQVSGNLQLAVTFLSLVVLPPIVEETFFRGFLFTSFRKRMGLWASIALTSVLFAIPHLLESQSGGSLLWVAGIDTFTLSIVLCLLREKTGSLWPGILLHGFKNGIAFMSLFILPLLHLGV